MYKTMYEFHIYASMVFIFNLSVCRNKYIYVKYAQNMQKYVLRAYKYYILLKM